MFQAVPVLGLILSLPHRLRTRYYVSGTTETTLFPNPMKRKKGYVGVFSEACCSSSRNCRIIILFRLLYVNSADPQKSLLLIPSFHVESDGLRLRSFPCSCFYSHFSVTDDKASYAPLTSQAVFNDI